MTTAQSPRLIEDGQNRYKIKISLPGGRYQLSLNSGGQNLVTDTLGLELRDTVPDTVVKVLTATGDAWFPNQRDWRSVIEDLPETTPLNSADARAVAEFLSSYSVAGARAAELRSVVENSELAAHLDAEEIPVRSLPKPPGGIFDADEEPEDSENDEADTRTATPRTENMGPVADRASDGSEPGAAESGSAESTPSAEELCDSLGPMVDVSETQLRDDVETLLEKGFPATVVRTVMTRRYGDAGQAPDLFDISGVGIVRGARLIRAGADSVTELAETSPLALADIDYISEDAATVIVEGAREIRAEGPSTADRLSAQTGVEADVFEAPLSMLAAAGVPPSGAMATLRELHAPPITVIDEVDGRQAFFLYEAGFTTPWELSQASVAELAEVPHVGEKTGRRIQTAANRLVASWEDQD